MLIKWKKDCIKGIEMIAAGGVSAEGVRPNIVLLPGVNDVSEKEWKLISIHCKPNIDAGELSEVKVKVVSGGKEKTVTAFKDMKIADQKVMIAECVNPDTLKGWLVSNVGENIRYMITKRLEEIGADDKVEIDDADEPTTASAGADA